MQKVGKKIISILKWNSKNLLSTQSTMFLIAAIISLISRGDDFWFLIGMSSILEGLYRIEKALKRDGK